MSGALRTGCAAGRPLDTPWSPPYSDTAQAAHPYTLASLTRLVPVSQIVFGTDFPYRTASEHVKG